MRNMFLFWLVLFLLPAGVAQQGDDSALLQRCSQNEKEAMKNAPQLQFLERVQAEWGSETRAVIETPEGRVDRIISFNDQPLGPDQQKKQQERLNKLLRDSEALHKEIDHQREETSRRKLMVASLSEAFVIKLSGMETDGRLRFTFEPNPKFIARNRETQVFKGMHGLLWIDPIHERIVAVHGELFKDVSFGWGILGRLYKGGKFKIVQSQIAPGVWRITTLDLDFKGRAFLFAGLRILRKETSTSFVPARSGMTIRAAIAQLLAHPEPSLEAGRENQSS